MSSMGTGKGTEKLGKYTVTLPTRYADLARSHADGNLSAYVTAAVRRALLQESVTPPPIDEAHWERETEQEHSNQTKGHNAA